MGPVGPVAPVGPGTGTMLTVHGSGPGQGQGGGQHAGGQTGGGHPKRKSLFWYTFIGHNLRSILCSGVQRGASRERGAV